MLEMHANAMEMLVKVLGKTLIYLERHTNTMEMLVGIFEIFGNGCCDIVIDNLDTDMTMQEILLTGTVMKLKMKNF